MFYWRHRQVAAVLQPAKEVLSETLRFPSESALDGIIKVAGGHLLPDNFFTDIRLRERAAIRGQPPATHSRIDLMTFVGATIDTSRAPYRHSVGIDTDAIIKSQFETDALVTIEIAIEVGGGKVGIVWVDENDKPFASAERFAVPGVRHVLSWIRLKQAHHLVFRNMMTDGTISSFRVSGLRAMVSH